MTEGPPPTPVVPGPVITPIDATAAAREIRVVTSADDGAELLNLLLAAPIAAIALDSEFRFDRAPVRLRSGKVWNDIRAQRPICFSLAALVTDHGSRAIVQAVLDVRRPGVARVLEEILRLRVPFVFHYSKAELFSLWSLGLDPDFPSLYDTHLAAACLHLGEHHRRIKQPADVGQRVQAEADKAKAHAHLLSLRGQCAQYGMAYPFSTSKEELRDRFLRLGDEDLDRRLIEYAAADAEWTLRLYLAQQAAIVADGLHTHLHTVEFPFAVANARMEWNGVPCSQERLQQLALGARQAATHYADILREHGVTTPGSRKQFLNLMTEVGLRHHCQRDGNDSTEDTVLEPIEHLHPAIRAFRLHGRYRRMASEEWLAGALTGADGRMHPDHAQLGATTGRNSCRNPNLAGIGRVLRPVVVAPTGRALIELDYSQIEVGVAAAEHDDPDLIAAYNSGDVYASMAQRFYAAEVSPTHRTLPPSEFKKLHRDLRDRMKTFVLAVLYNIQPPAIAARFGISQREAAAERERFLDLYPRLKQRLAESSSYGAVRGYATVVSGLRRQRSTKGRPDTWTKNFLRNTPIQGSAAVVFKHAIVLLDREFRGTPVQLVLPVHDSILIECDRQDLDEVCERAAALMRHALRHYYPKLQPRIDVNRVDVTCWNKDGRS
ncbi:MAG: DNA polymerase, partial [Planctomycetota bacterium]